MGPEVTEDFCGVLGGISLKALLSRIFYLSSYTKGPRCSANLLYNLLDMPHLVSLSYRGAFRYPLVDINL